MSRVPVVRFLRPFVFVWLLWSFLLILNCDGFTPRIRSTRISATKRKSFAVSSEVNNDSIPSSLDIVLFGMGDYRINDHEGLMKALSQNGKKWVMPLTILESHSLKHIPMAMTHTTDTSSMLHAALTSLETELESKLSLPLHCCVRSDDNDDGKCNNGVWRTLNQVISQVQTTHPSIEDVTVHVCDLGPVDNELQYGPYAQLMNGIHDDHASAITIEPWDCNLQSEPWKDVKRDPPSFVDSFPDFQKRYNNDINPLATIQGLPETKKENAFKLDTFCHNIPSKSDIHSMICKSLSQPSSLTTSNNNTGLYATHWGGMSISETMSEPQIQKLLKVYFEDAHADDEALMNLLPWWDGDNSSTLDGGKFLKSNPTSLEHASLKWMMTNKKNNFSPNTNNLISGELVTRFLAAPLLYGMVSPRHIWTIAEDFKGPPRTFFFQPKSNIQSMVEAREWHRLLAAKQILSSSNQQQPQKDDCEIMSYGYWRWHGYLCRYAKAPLLSKKQQQLITNDEFENDTTGIVLVHGFGASGSQFRKTISELSSSLKHMCSSSTNTNSSSNNNNNNYYNLPQEVMAPDLIGFGHCEKPPITFTQYMWSAFVSDFTKQTTKKHQWDSYFIGGNSIGGYTSMMTAADDDQTTTSAGWPLLTSSGTVGAGKCKGLILMNSAGRILTPEEVDKATKENVSSTVLSVAEATIMNLLGPCKPPPQLVAKVGGNGLLAYLRPRIQSICKNLYPTNPSAVDEELCSSILRDSLDPGAINVMISGSKLPPPRTANELLSANFGSPSHKMEGVFTGPVLVAQGMLDPLNDAKGRASLLESLRPDVTVSPINGGHCPHDELPKDMAVAMANWMKEQSPNV